MATGTDDQSGASKSWITSWAARSIAVRYSVRSAAAAVALALACAIAHAQGPVDVPSADGRLVHAVWQPSGKVERWIVSLHGSEGSAKTDLGIWQRSVATRGIGVLTIQWWLGKGDDYLPPLAIYREIDVAAKRLGIAPGSAMLHGFSRGSANLYAVAAIDAGRGRKLFSVFVANAGGASMDYPPNRAIIEGKFGSRPLAGTRWITVCGERDPQPDRSGCPGMRRTASWLKEQGAEIVAAIEDPQGGHGALHLNPRNTERVLDLIAR